MDGISVFFVVIDNSLLMFKIFVCLSLVRAGFRRTDLKVRVIRVDRHIAIGCVSVCELVWFHNIMADKWEIKVEKVC